MIAQQAFLTLQDRLSPHLLAQGAELELLFTAWLAHGHILIEGPPGVGKTLTARLMAQGLSQGFRRVQFTSDLLPSDIIGGNIYVPGQQGYTFIPGPIFSDCLLADEINRTPPRTQSALLEAMEERQVSVDGKTTRLSQDFFVVATQNPHEFEGTFPLPEAQTDRFMFKIVIGHASLEVDEKILRLNLGRQVLARPQIEPLAVNRAALDLEIESTKIDDSLLSYIARLLAATRKHPQIAFGSSIRGGLALALGSKAKARIQGRDFVTIDDIKALIAPCLRHRLRLKAEAQISGIKDTDILAQLAREVEFPK